MQGAWSLTGVLSIWVDGLVTLDAGRDRLRRRVYASTGTALYDAIVKGLEYARQGRHRKKALIVLTDGNDTSSRMKERDAVDAIRRSDVLVYALGIGYRERGGVPHDVLAEGLGTPDPVDMPRLRRLAEPVGGRAYELAGAGDSEVDTIDGAVVDIARELRLQYTIGYYSTNSRKDGKSRRLRVDTTRPGLSVRARRGYWAPRQP